jgi:hypothetical protein
MQSGAGMGSGGAAFGVGEDLARYDAAAEVMRRLAVNAGSDLDASLLLVDTVEVRLDVRGVHLHLDTHPPAEGRPNVGDVPPLRAHLATLVREDGPLAGIRIVVDGTYEVAAPPAGSGAAAAPRTDDLRADGISADPTAEEFARAWSTSFARAVRAAAGDDGLLTIHEARDLAGARGAAALFADNALHLLERSGREAIEVERLVQAAHAYALTVAKKAAGDDNHISVGEATSLPGDLFADFHLLRSLGIDNA